jgi:hypothetical protein
VLGFTPTLGQSRVATTTSPFFSFSSNVDEVDNENETSNFDFDLEKNIKTILQGCLKT